MARKSKIVTLKLYLRDSHLRTVELQEKLAKAENYENAALVKSFKEVLCRALELCEDGENNPFIPPHESAMPGIMPNRGED